MQTLIFRVLVLMFIAAALAVAHSWNTGVLLHLKPQEPFDWGSLSAASERNSGNSAAAAPQAGEELVKAPDPAPTQEDPATVPPKIDGAAPAVGTPSLAPTTSPRAGESDNQINLDRAKQLFDLQYIGAKQVVFIDARARDVYQKGHIEGAMSLPAGELGPMLPSKVRDYLTGNAVVIYCQGAECSDSHDVAKRLQAANIGITPIFIFKDGYPAWVAAGHPTMTGPELGFQ